MQKLPENRRFLKLIILILLGICSAFLQSNRGGFELKHLPQSTSSDLTDLDTFKKAFDNQQSNIQVKQVGRIAKVLRDDDHGLRHQRFVVQLDSGQKILIAHNIDLAAKVEGLKEGEIISFSGEYEWNNKGGVVHWTHRDPRGHHPSGWLLYNNRKYD
ncbi:DUF3465 domain-containing protein [Methyloglobulus sp.]|uniref:DUF3465 domain-containing protein n=1 Tax=Methyloglobulus sp. TaxID=2518622 RepID=UPI0032B83711